MPKPVGRCSNCEEEGALGEPCGGANCLGAGFFFEPIEGREGNVEARAVRLEATRREEVEARKLEEDLEADVRALTEEVEGLRVDASGRTWPAWMRNPWLWTLVVAAVAISLVVAGVGGDSADDASQSQPERKISKDAKALNATIKGCESGDLDKCEQAARWLKQGVGAQPSPIRAQKLMERACDGGRLEACQGLAEWLEDAPKQGDVGRARALYKLACDGGHALACAKVAHRIRDLGADLSSARALAQRACDGKAYEGCYLLASMFERGEGGERWADKAEYLYALACDEKVGDACNDLAVMLGENGGTPGALEKVRGLFVRACELRSAAGCFSIGMLHEQGEGVLPSFSKALEYYRNACDLGHGHGCYRVARAYRDGKGVRVDPYRAQEFMRRACSNGYSKACN